MPSNNEVYRQLPILPDGKYDAECCEYVAVTIGDAVRTTRRINSYFSDTSRVLAGRPISAYGLADYDHRKREVLHYC
jgi:hypothetical protein